MKTQKLNKTSLIMGGVIFFIVAMLTVAISSMVISNANAEEETVDTNDTKGIEFTILDKSTGDPIEGAEAIYYQKGKKQQTTQTISPRSGADGKITADISYTGGVTYIFEVSTDTLFAAWEKTMISVEIPPIKNTFRLEPKASTKVKVVADGGENAEFRYLFEGAYKKAHETDFDCNDLEALKIVPDEDEGIVYIKEGETTKCTLKDNIDFKLTGDKVTLSGDTITVKVNTAPTHEVSITAPSGGGSVTAPNLTLPNGCTYSVQFKKIVFSTNSNTNSNSEIIVEARADENYVFDAWQDSNGNDIYMADTCVFQENLDLKALFKTHGQNDITIISDKPVYTFEFKKSGSDPKCSDTAETKRIIEKSPRDVFAIYFAPNSYFGFDADEYGNNDSARLIAAGLGSITSYEYKYAFSYDKDINNLISFNDMKVTEWENRNPKTIVIGGAPTDGENADNGAQTGDITYIAIALLVCVGITSAVVAVRVRARRK